MANCRFFEVGIWSPKSEVKENTEKEFLERIYSDSEIDDAYISLPDGKGNVGLIVGRKSNDKDSISMFSVVLNNVNGIIDCFGFNSITQQEYSKIVKRQSPPSPKVKDFIFAYIIGGIICVIVGIILLVGMCSH